MNKDNPHKIFLNLLQIAVPNAPIEDLERMVHRLLKLYSQPHRAHHTADHIIDLSNQFNFYQQKLGASAPSTAAAILFHDAVYECQHGKDEEQSTTLAIAALKSLNAPITLINATTQKIMATAKHGTTNDPATALFLDMDMSPLGSRPDVYARYVQNTEAEYCQKLGITPAQFRTARTTLFLIPVLTQGPIFQTPEYAALEPLARYNIAQEISIYKQEGLIPS